MSVYTNTTMVTAETMARSASTVALSGITATIYPKIIQSPSEQSRVVMVTVVQIASEVNQSEAPSAAANSQDPIDNDQHPISSSFKATTTATANYYDYGAQVLRDRACSRSQGELYGPIHYSSRHG